MPLLEVKNLRTWFPVTGGVLRRHIDDEVLVRVGLLKYILIRRRTAELVDILGTQLIRRNDELALLYEKIKIMQSSLRKGEVRKLYIYAHHGNAGLV